MNDVKGLNELVGDQAIGGSIKTSWVDQRRRRLASALRNQHQGPILVIGGGPSVIPDLAELSLKHRCQPVVTISANEHGFKQDIYPVNYAVCLDAYHGATRMPMQELLGRPGVSIVTPCWFGDYRLPEFKGNMNSGLVAIYVALLMGACPVIVTGLDFYRWRDKDAGTYFHARDADSNSTRKKGDNFVKQIKNLVERVGGKGAPVRPLSGPLLEVFPKFSPAETVQPWAGSRYTTFLCGLEEIQVENGPKLSSFGAGHLPPRYVCPMGDREALGFLGNARARAIEPAGHWLCSYNPQKPGVVFQPYEVPVD